MFNIVLFEPEIPPNTGNIIRLAANTGCRLHLVEPLGFFLDDKHLRRAGLDYSDLETLQRHASWSDFCQTQAPQRLFAFTTKGQRGHYEACFQRGDYLLFGPETRGLPQALRESLDPGQLLRLPMRPSSRSMNLSNAVAVAVYEAWRQLDFAME